jgi:hypothetical protein
MILVFVSVKGWKYSLKFLNKIQDFEKYFVMYLNVCLLLEYLNFLTAQNIIISVSTLNFREFL